MASDVGNTAVKQKSRNGYEPNDLESSENGVPEGGRAV